jgi:hypothetical protein
MEEAEVLAPKVQRSVPPIPKSLETAEWTCVSKSWHHHQMEIATVGQDEGGLSWLRKVANPKQLYFGPNDGRTIWRCGKCGGDIFTATVAHPVWDGPFPCSGSGQCEYEQALYCSVCEKVPSFSGDPIRGQPGLY